jgi:hypothetical protein
MARFLLNSERYEHCSRVTGESFWGGGMTRRVGPRLSIVLLSGGLERDLERAVSALSDLVLSLSAQLIVVREDLGPSDRERVSRFVQQHGFTCTFIEAGRGRGAMSDQALRYVTGDVVTVREDSMVGDGEWLSAFGDAGSVVDSSWSSERPVVSEVQDDRSAHRGPTERRTTAVSRRRVEPGVESVS